MKINKYLIDDEIFFYDLKGRVKSINEFPMIMVDGSIEKGDLNEGKPDKLIFNENGNIIEINKYDNDGILHLLLKYDYNNDGLICNENIFWNSPENKESVSVELIESKRYEYNNKAELVKITFVEYDNVPNKTKNHSIKTLKYNEFGVLIEMTIEESRRGRIHNETSKFYYFACENIIKLDIGKDTFYYLFDNDANLIEKLRTIRYQSQYSAWDSEQLDDIRIPGWKVTQLYDHLNNLIERNIFDDFELDDEIEQKLFYLNSQRYNTLSDYLKTDSDIEKYEQSIKTKITTFKGNGVLKRSYKYNYKFDEKLNWVEKIEYTNEGKNIYRREIEYFE